MTSSRRVARSAYPDVGILLTQSDRVTDFTEDHIDVAIRIGELPDSNLIVARVGEIRHVVCGSPKYLEEHPELKSPADLSKLHCVTFDRLNDAQNWAFRSGKTSITTPVRSRLIVNTAEAAIDAAIAGVGITRVLSYQVAREVRDGRLKLALTDFEPHASPINLIYPSQGRMPMKLRAFLDFVAPRLRERLASL